MRVLLIQRWTRLDRGNSIAACTSVPCKEEVVENPWLARGFISSLRLDGTFGGHGIISADSHRKHTVYAILNIPCVGGGRQEVSSVFSSTSNLLFQYTCPRRFDNMEPPNCRRQGYAGGLVWLHVLSRTMRRVRMSLVLDFIRKPPVPEFPEPWVSSL